MSTTAPSTSLREDLLRPEAYGRKPPFQVELIETHISLVFLAEGVVYKVKKAVDLSSDLPGNVAARVHNHGQARGAFLRLQSNRYFATSKNRRNLVLVTRYLFHIRRGSWRIRYSHSRLRRCIQTGAR